MAIHDKIMAPTGFEPATPGLKVQYSNRAELRSLSRLRKSCYLKLMYKQGFFV